MRYTAARTADYYNEMSYRIYVTDMLRNIPQMTYIESRWVDVVGFGRHERRVEQTAEQVIDHVLAELGQT